MKITLYSWDVTMTTYMKISTNLSYCFHYFYFNKFTLLYFREIIINSAMRSGSVVSWLYVIKSQPLSSLPLRQAFDIN